MKNSRRLGQGELLKEIHLIQKLPPKALDPRSFELKYVNVTGLTSKLEPKLSETHSNA